MACSVSKTCLLSVFRLLSRSPACLRPQFLTGTVRHRGMATSSAPEGASSPPEMLKSTAEWPFVERLLPDRLVPPPPAAAHESWQPSGWKMPSKEKPDLPYFVERTANHMVPVYLGTYNRGRVRRTLIKRVHGNVWALEKDVRAFLEARHGAIIASTVDEPRLHVMFKGDFVNDVKQWLLDKGF